MTDAGPEFREELKVREAGKLSRTVRSGGPRTAAGKVLSAKNSLKTGMYSNLPVLPGESQESYLELEGYFIKEYNPQTITGGMLVSDLTKNVWKKLRLERRGCPKFCVNGQLAGNCHIDRRHHEQQETRCT